MVPRTTMEWKFLLCLSLCSLFASPGHTRTGQGNIVGLVSDPTAAVIPGVSVNAKNPETGFAYSALTNQQGLYRISYVNPGVYEITYEAPGFGRVVRSRILVRSTETTAVDVTLEVGSVVASIEVKAEAPLLEFETSMVGHLVTGETLNRLPAAQQRAVTTAG